jgi:SRSO17 transposase
MEELWEFQATFHDCFARSEPRLHFFDSMVGQCRKLARKSIEPIALGVEGGTSRGMQRLIRDVSWEEAQMRWNSQQLVAATLGAPDGGLLFAETGFAKTGSHSVGVARQDCGSLGKGEHGQVGVCAASASRQGYALVDKRFCLPEAWCNDPPAARRAACQGPQALTCQTKPQLAAAMLQAMAHEGLLPCKSLVAACLYGNRPDCLDAIDACVGVTALGALPSETRCWVQRPPTTEPMDRSKGEARAQRGGVDTVPNACSVAAVAAHLPASRWYRRTVAAGTKGPSASACARQRLTLCKEGRPERRVWRVIKRTVGAEPAYSSALSKAPASTPLGALVWRSGVRWAIEPGFAERNTD